MKGKDNDQLSPDQLKDKIAYLKNELSALYTVEEEKLKQQTKEEKHDKQHHDKHNEKSASKEKKTKKHSEEITKEEEQNSQTRLLEVIEELEKDLVFLLKENSRLKEEKLVVIADGENLKRRLYAEEEKLKRYRSVSLAEKILPVLDNFERALKVENTSQEVKNFLMGFEMIKNLVEKALEEEQIVEINANPGDDFDPSLHHAIEVVETKEFESGKIVKVLQKGYKLHDRVIRHAQVTIAK